MADSGTSAPIESKADLIEALSSGSKPKSDWRVGTEHEKFVFYADSLGPVPYEGENGIGALLDGVAKKTGWSPLYDRDKVIGLTDTRTGASISLEPGGQFELSGAALSNLHDTCSETHRHLTVLREVADPMGIKFLGIGVTPDWAVTDIPVMPKSRYGIMAPYMREVGTLGTSMMFRSCTVQANLDFSSEADMVKKLRVSLALQPIATALFANSPFVDGKPSGFLSFRSQIWLHTDPDRTGMLPFAFEEGMSFERYVDYALDVPMYFVIRNGQYVNCAGESFRAFLRGELPQLPGEKPLKRDWEDHLSTIFPEVRLKRFLEMRGADCGPWEEICALPALWTGLLYDEDSLEGAWDLVKDWTAEERWQLRKDVPVKALETEFRDGTVHDLTRLVLPLAQAGLERRNLRNWEDMDETMHLAPLRRVVETGKTQAERLLDCYHGPWEGDIKRVYAVAAY
ncbi:glutamate--cysteine ligase [Cucumibacter marinus]|uniref:glutamate--cysteine ligase n=1 Tax=Cucumibacter marinus TaxID=1121252 RepID=UPI0004295E46|nr:glutamate--cysteine ligase [Cucumibacter marinus]